jgi:hypothetical protein
MVLSVWYLVGCAFRKVVLNAPFDAIERSMYAWYIRSKHAGYVYPASFDRLPEVAGWVCDGRRLTLLGRLKAATLSK